MVSNSPLRIHDRLGSWSQRFLRRKRFPILIYSIEPRLHFSISTHSTWNSSNLCWYKSLKHLRKLVRNEIELLYRFSIPKEKLKRLLFWNSFLSLLHSQVSPLMIASMINLNNLTYDTSLSHTSSVLSITIIVFIAIAIVLEIYVIRKHNGRYQLYEFNLKYGACIEGLNTEIFIGRY
jgi:hypothetical protein